MKRTKLLVLFIIIMVIASLMTIMLAGCRPGYREVWEPVEVPTLEWVDNDDAYLIASRIREDILDDKLDVTNIKAIMRSDGTFEGFDYYIKERTETWAPLEHLRNVEKLLRAYNSEGNKDYHNEDIKQFANKAIAFWVDKDFYCSWSGWNNTIGLGLSIPNILLLDDGSIPKADRDKLLSRIKSTLLQNSKKRFKLYEREVSEGGGNLTDQVNATLKVAVIENDGNIMMWLKGLLENELRAFPAYKGAKYHRWDAEGPKEDFSFQQHDQLIYYGGYGEVFINGLDRYMRYTKGTQYMLSKKALDFLSDFVVEGMQFATRNGYRDISSAGRGIARVGGLKGIFSNLDRISLTLLDYADKYNNISDDRVAKLTKMRKDRYTDKDNGAGGHRYFYESDYNVYNDTKYMASVRHASNRTRVYEYLNFENYLGYYTGVGATFFYVDGDEYFNLMPVYDWNKVPGTTTRYGRLPKLGQDASYNRYGGTDKVGGVSNGKVGASTYRQSDHLVSANKAYFMFEDGVVCLGNDIYTGMPEKVITAVNQTTWKGDVVVSSNGKTQTIKEDSSKELQGKFDYVYHNKISYITDSDVNVAMDKNRTGAWNRVYTKGSADSVSANVFTIDIDHGRWPIGKQYAYTVLMNTTPEATAKYVASPTLQVIANDKGVQAVYDSKNDILQVIFLKAGSIDVNGKTISSNGACSMLVDNLSSDAIIWVASNDYKSHDIDIKCGNIAKSVNITKKSTKV